MKLKLAPLAPLLAVCVPLLALAEEPALHDVALPELGATAKGTNANFNRDWPASKALLPKKGGTIFSPFEGAAIDIRLIMPVEIQAVEIMGLDYRNTRQVSGVDIFIGGKKIAHAELPEDPGTPVRVEVKPDGPSQNVRLVATGGHPNRVGKDGKKGPDWGGFAKIAVLSSTDLAGKLQPVEGYVVEPSADFIAPTAQSRAKPEVQVIGQPRMAQGHPRTLWDQQDITEFKALLKTNDKLASQFQALTKAMDARLAKPATVPQPGKDSDGAWTHLPEKEVGPIHNELSLVISNLGTVYALSGEEKYADYARKLLLAYTDVYEFYAPGNRPGFKHDQGKCFDQRLGDSTWLIPVARGYDLIYNSPGLTAEERGRIENGLLKAAANFIAANSHHLRGATNWSAISTAAVLITGYATDDEDLIQLAMYGPKGTEEKPTGGVMLHFSEKSINADGLWAEGAIGYQFMAMQALIADAEVLWRNGIDMYRHRDAALKKLFDSPIAYSFPDLKTPSVHDSHSVSIVGRESYLYEYGYLRYRDPRYLLILNDPTVTTRLDTRFQQFPISVLYERDESEQVPPIEWLSENFNDVGYGILRNTSPAGTVSLLLDYGPNRSHGHPDKLNIDLWTTATGRLIPDPGMVWYEQPLYRNWYRTSLAHNTLILDEQDQTDSDGALLVYGFGDTMAMQRAHALKASPGVVMDRSLFLTAEYMADIFGAFARLPRKMDLAWHVRGEFSSTLPLEPKEPSPPLERGYSELANVASAKTSQPWNASFQLGQTQVRLHAAGSSATETEVITGDGWLGRERPKTILQRRHTGETVYGNVIDFAGTAGGHVEGTTLEGSLESGYALLSVQTQRGTDLCFASYRPGTYQAGGLETDALQSFARQKGGQVTALFLGGGSFLKVGNARLALTEPGIALLEKADTGAYILTNLSPRPAQVTLAFAPVEKMEVHTVDARGNRSGASAPFQSTQTLAAGQKLEFAPPGQPSVQEGRAAMLRKRQEEQAARLQAALDEATARSQARAKDAEQHAVPAGTLIVTQAEAFTGEGNGKVNIVPKKTGHLGTSLSGWNGEGHWIEWEVEVPADGYYNLSLVYCTEQNNSEREIQINGHVQEPYAPLVLPSTGGYSNSSDDWKLFTALDPITTRPLLLKFQAGKNTLRLTNTNGAAANLDYLAISSPDAVPTREKAASAPQAP